MWETNLQIIDGVIPWGVGGKSTAPGEQVILLGGTKLFAKDKNHVDNLQHGVICEF